MEKIDQKSRKTRDIRFCAQRKIERENTGSGNKKDCFSGAQDTNKQKKRCAPHTKKSTKYRVHKQKKGKDII